MDALGTIAFVLTLLPAVPIAMFVAECLAAVLVRPRPRDDTARDDTARDDDAPPRTVILIPAHDEETEIAATLDSIMGQVRAPDRVLVVAHNCKDRTAEIARARGADVLEAVDAGAEGKPSALRTGLQTLVEDPPDVVITLDADCTVSEGGLASLARAAHRTGRPVQATYLFAGPQRPSGMQGVSRLALLIKNRVRPLGLANLGLPCVLNGSGSAYPYALLRDALEGKGGIVEDRQYSVDLALAGHAPLFCPGVDVWSRLPEERGSAYEQRRRWEHGNLHVVFSGAPRLLLAGLVRLRPRLFFFGLDLLIPPVALLVLFWGVLAVFAAATFPATGAVAPLCVAAGAGAALVLAIVLASLRFEGPRETVRTLVWMPLYVAWKAPLYMAYIHRREKRWIRTARDRGVAEVQPDEESEERPEEGPKERTAR